MCVCVCVCCVCVWMWENVKNAKFNVYRACIQTDEQILKNLYLDSAQSTLKEFLKIINPVLYMSNTCIVSHIRRISRTLKTSMV